MSELIINVQDQTKWGVPKIGRTISEIGRFFQLKQRIKFLN